MEPEDLPALEELIKDLWEADRFCSDSVDGAVLIRDYTNHCVEKSDMREVVVHDGRPVGFMLATTGRKPTQWDNDVRKWLPDFKELKESKNCRVSDYIKICDSFDNLVEKYAPKHGHELVLLILNSEYQSKGLGSMLMDLFSDVCEADGCGWYLVTDTQCDYGFYDHRGYTCLGHETMDLSLLDGDVKHTTFLYQIDGKQSIKR